MKNSYMRRLGGFTLIELLVVVLIIGILSAVALPQYHKVVLKSRIQKHILWLRSVAQAQEIFYLANGTYASSFHDLDIELPAGVKEQNINGSHHIFYKNMHCSMGLNSNKQITNAACTSSTWDVLSVTFAHSPGNTYAPRNVLNCPNQGHPQSALMQEVCLSLGFVPVNGNSNFSQLVF